MAKGIRVPVHDPCLDELLCGVQAHVDWQLPESTSTPAIVEIAKEYEQRNRRLYELAGRVRAESQERSETDPGLDELLKAIQKHSEWRLLTQRFEGLEDYLYKHNQEDRRLYDVAAVARLQAFQRSPFRDVYLDVEDLAAVLAGKKTVMRIPVEHNLTGKVLQSYYREGGPYPLISTPKDAGPTLLELALSHEVRILSVRMEKLGEIQNPDHAEAGREGYADWPSFLDDFWERYGRILFDCQVWRYELELIKRFAR